MKKFVLWVCIAILILILCAFFFSKSPLDINGQIIMNLYTNGQNNIAVYDCSKKEYRNIQADGLQAIWSKNNTIFLNQYDVISEYDFVANEENVIYHGENFDYIAVSNENTLSLAKNNNIYSYNTITRERKELVRDNGSRIHSWGDNGSLLYYSDMNGRIKAIDILSGNITEYNDGIDPHVFGTKLAYTNNGKLFVEDLQSRKVYSYVGSAYSFCFSPDGSTLLVEDEISMRTAIKNLLKREIVLGHSIVVWDYAKNKKMTLIDACVPSPYLLCDWK